MLSKDLIAASATPLILAILSGGDSYGYQLIRKVKEFSGDTIRWSDGMLYPVLHRLEARKSISSYWQQSELGRKRKYYKLTPDGMNELRKEKAQWLTVHQTLESVWGLTNV